MTIRQPVKNTMDRIGIDWKEFEGAELEKVTVENRFGYGTCETSPLVRACIEKIYNINNDYEIGIQDVKLDDFDRLRYFVLEVDSNAYSVCVD